MSVPPNTRPATPATIPGAANTLQISITRSVLLDGPIARQIMGLAWPVLVVLALQTFSAVAETYFVSFLGTDALAGVALVFPVFMLMAMMSNGGIGGGVASAVARAIGSGRPQDADALLSHAVFVGLVFGAVFTLGVWLFGPALFRQMGGSGEALATAVLYANVLFLSAIPGWIANLMAAALRGAGNVRVPALVTAAGALITLGLSPLFIFGWGPVPAMGVAGAGLALGVFNVGSALALYLFVRSPDSPLRLARVRPQLRFLGEILKVGLLSAIGTVLANLTVVVTTGLVGAQGRDAIAGYGMASRLDYILIPLVFALGTASLTMVGTNVGGGQHARARRIAWTGAALSAGVTGSIGMLAALFPQVWMQLFSSEATVISVGVGYLQRVAPFYVLYGAGMALYFASQGAGRMVWPFGAGVVRLAMVMVLGSYWVNGLHGSLDGLFWLAGVGYVVFGAINLYAMASGRGWRHLAAHTRTT